MANQIEEARELLAAGEHTCVLVSGDTKLTSDAHGVRALLGWLQTDAETLRGAAVADRVVGAAAAWLMVKAGFRQVHACLLSQSALAILEAADLEVSWDQLTKNILNRSGDGICPLEQACLEVQDADSAYVAIQETVKQLMSRNKGV